MDRFSQGTTIRGGLFLTEHTVSEGGVVLVAIGVVTARKFWRAGEAIGSAEGFA